MTDGQVLEAFLAAIYVDSEARARFIADPFGEARRAGVSEADAQALVDVDRVGLELVVASLARKRHHRAQHRRGYPLGH